MSKSPQRLTCNLYVDFQPSETDLPGIGDYIVTAGKRARSAYLITAVRQIKRARRLIDSQRLQFTCQRAPVEDAVAVPHFKFRWYPRVKKVNPAK